MTWYAIGGGAVALATAGMFWLLGAMNQAASEQARLERQARYRQGIL